MSVHWKFWGGLTVLASVILIFRSAEVEADSEPAQKPPVADEPLPPVIRKPAPPIPPAVRNYRFSIQKNEKFPNAARPEASAVSTEKGLSVTLQPEKNEFSGNGPVAFRVVLKNDSEKPFLLYNADRLGETARLVFANQGNANQWAITMQPDRKRGDNSTTLKPGESLTYTAVVEQVLQIQPIPRPLPQPLPRPVPFKGQPAVQPVPEQPAFQKKIQAQPGKGQPIPIKPLPADRRPIRPPVAVGPVLPVGMGDCQTQLFLEFQRSPLEKKFALPHWTGKIATKTVSFKLGKPTPQPIQPPIVGPPILPPQGPLTKEQAIQQAAAAAERALQANYQPIPNIKPAKTGKWIEQPGKTADVKKLKQGGWTVQWTLFPRSGYSYNIVVIVGVNGGAQVREVFTGYSP